MQLLNLLQGSWRRTEPTLPLPYGPLAGEWTRRVLAPSRPVFDHSKAGVAKTAFTGLSLAYEGEARPGGLPFVLAGSRVLIVCHLPLFLKRGDGVAFLLTYVFSYSYNSFKAQTGPPIF